MPGNPEVSSADPQENGDELLFDAVLRPHRSLSPSGFLILMITIVIASFVAGAAFWRIGAWPVPAFLGLDALLIYIGFKLNYRAGRMFETVQLTKEELVVRQVSPNGKVSERVFQPYWVRVDLTTLGSDNNRLSLSSHGRRIGLGQFLTPEERASFAAALQAALLQQKNTHST